MIENDPNEVRQLTHTFNQFVTDIALSSAADLLDDSKNRELLNFCRNAISENELSETDKIEFAAPCEN